MSKLLNKSTPTVEELAKKYKVSTVAVRKELLRGVKVEKEHTNNPKIAREIALDHLGEKLDYYKRLKKVDEGISAGPEREVDHTIGDLTGSSRKVMKVDEVKLPKVPEKVKKKAKKTMAVGLTMANMATGADIYDRASRGVGSPARDIAAAASGLPGKIGYAAMGTNWSVKGYDKAKEHLRTKQKLKEDLRKWFREKWVRYDTKGNIKGPCAREEGEGKPKCRPLASARAMSKDERAKSAKRKRREDPVADRSGKGGKPIMVRTEETLLEKNVPTNPALWARAKAQARAKFDVYPSAYANGWASKWYKSKGGGWKSAKETVDEACWDTHKQEGMKKKGNRMVPNCVPKEEKNLVPADSTERGIYEDWQSVNRKDKTDGLSQAAVNAYRRENPGSKLKTAVTEKNPKGKRAARRKSFCSRMGGMKKRLTSAKTARDPDSRINKALRRWNCEESVINELKAETLGSYIKKASASRREALNKEGGAKADVKTWGKRQKGITTAIKKLTNEETKMENKDLINEALVNILENNLVDMKENLMIALQEKAMEKLEERKKEIAANYFAQ